MSTNAGKPVRPDLQEISKTLSLLFTQGDVLELRALKTAKKTQSGYYTDQTKLARDAAALDGQAPGTYVTLNAINPDLLARSANRLKTCVDTGGTTSDADIARRQYLPVDCDPVRPSGISSSEPEHNAALQKAQECARFLTAIGFPENSLVVADSGNGGHVLARIDLPNDVVSTRLIQDCLKALDAILSDSAVKIDTANFNAGRIWKLYGTVARKGDSVPDRPHRLSRTLTVPDELAVAPRGCLERLATMKPLEPEREARPYTGKPGQRPLDLAVWLPEHGLTVKFASPWGDKATKYVLESCPFDPAHAGTSVAVFQFASGAISFRCLHNGCAGKTWTDLRRLKEPGYTDGQDKHSEPARDAKEPEVYVSPPLQRERDVHLAQILNAVVALIRRYVVLEATQADAIALWVAHTWAIERAEVTPYLSITSAEKRCGKTRLLELLSSLVARPWPTGRVTAAVLVRKVARDTPTLLLDESDAAFKGEKEYVEALRAILNAGYRRGGVASMCVRAKGNDWELKDFPVFGAKAIAGIGKLPDTIADRSIPIILRRKAPEDPVIRFRQRDARAEALPIAEQLSLWAADTTILDGATPSIPTSLDDRSADGWEPLLAIADAAGADWPARARAASLAVSAGEGRDDDSLGVRLLKDVRNIFEQENVTRLSTADLIQALILIEESPWADMRGRPLNATGLAKLLRPYDVKPRQVRIGETTLKGYAKGDFIDAWRRYAPLSPCKAETPETGETSDGNHSIPADPVVSGVSLVSPAQGIGQDPTQEEGEV